MDPKAITLQILPHLDLGQIRLLQVVLIQLWGMVHPTPRDHLQQHTPILITAIPILAIMLIPTIKQHLKKPQPPPLQTKAPTKPPWSPAWRPFKKVTASSHPVIAVAVSIWIA